MQAAVSTYIKFIPFSNFNLWDVKVYLSNLNVFNQKFTLVKLYNILKLVKREKEIIKDAEYNLLGVKSYGLGVFHRETKKSSDIKSKYLGKLHEGDLFILVWELLVVLLV